MLFFVFGIFSMLIAVLYYYSLLVSDMSWIVATMTKDNMFDSEVALINAADQKLYLAKQKGRNKVI